MRSDDGLWYVRDGGETTGPYSAAELEDLRRAGKLDWRHEVSRDQLQWVSATTLDGPRRPTTWGGQGPGPGRRRGWPLVAAVGGVLAAGLVWAALDSTGGAPSGSTEGAAILRVLEEDEAADQEIMQAVGDAQTPSVYAAAIGAYLDRMAGVDLSECPPRFRVAYRHHLAAWRELKEATEGLPDGFLDGFFAGVLNSILRHEVDGGITRMNDAVAEASREVKRTYREVEAEAARYDVALP